MNTYTIVGFYRDYDQPSVHHVNAESPAKAVIKLWDTLESCEQRQNFELVEIFAGASIGLSNQNTTLSLSRAVKKALDGEF